MTIERDAPLGAAAVRLFEVEPDLMRFLAAEDRPEARLTCVPIAEVGAGEIDIRELLAPARAFGAIVLDGMLLQSMRLSGHAGLRLLGPGDIISLTESPEAGMVHDAGARVTTTMHVALLGHELLLACRRWPWLVAGLHAREAEAAERIVTQLMICQLPRVDERLLAMLWLLAESWGQVTSSGTFLPVELTHSALGGLIGARRPTVTLALRELTDRGSLVRQAGGWLLLTPPADTQLSAGKPIDEPRVLPAGTAAWSGAPQPRPDGEATRVIREELERTISRLRDEHSLQIGRLRANLEAFASTRETIAGRRAGTSVTSRRAPS